MEYVIIENNKIIRKFSTNNPPEAGWVPIPIDSSAQVGMPINLLDENYNLKDDATLRAEGILRENQALSGNWEIVPDYSRKTYYSKDTGQEKKFPVGETPDFSIYTDKKPEPMQKWDTSLNGWVIDLDQYKLYQVSNVKRRIESNLRGRVELLPQKWFKFSQMLQTEITEVKKYLEAGVFQSAVFYYFFTKDTETESTGSFSLADVTQMETAGLVHYIVWTNLRKEIVSQIQTASTKDAVDLIVLNAGLQGEI